MQRAESPLKESTTSLASVQLDLTDNQLSQLVKVAETLPKDQQRMLVQVLTNKLAQGSAKKPSHYSNLY